MAPAPDLEGKIGSSPDGEAEDLEPPSRVLVAQTIPRFAAHETTQFEPGGHHAIARTLFATPTGLEPATSAVTGRRSNQLSYGASMYLGGAWWCGVPPTGFEPVLPP